MAAATFDKVIGVGFEDLAQRHDAENCAGKDSDDERSQEQRRLRLHSKNNWCAPTPVGQVCERDQRKLAGACARKDGNHKRLANDLAKNAPATRSDGEANGDFFGAVGRARCKQAAKIGAGGEQHDAGQCHNRDEEGAYRGTHKIPQQAWLRQLDR